MCHARMFLHINPIGYISIKEENGIATRTANDQFPHIIISPARNLITLPIEV